ncbi:MAG: DUF6439 family protein [Cyanobium sp.]
MSSRPVTSSIHQGGSGSPTGSAARAAGGWPEGSADLAEQLMHTLAIGDREWHAVKAQRARRAAEQIAAALVQLVACDDPRRRDPDEARQRAVDLLENALAWLKGEISDPGCPDHRR